jgi:hypothetical protein
VRTQLIREAAESLSSDSLTVSSPPGTPAGASSQHVSVRARMYHRAGINADILVGGVIRVGDPVVEL